MDAAPYSKRQRRAERKALKKERKEKRRLSKKKRRREEEAWREKLLFAAQGDEPGGYEDWADDEDEYEEDWFESVARKFEAKRFAEAEQRRRSEEASAAQRRKRQRRTESRRPPSADETPPSTPPRTIPTTPPSTPPREREREDATKNHYETLGVSRDATRDEIRKAYYRMARVVHPDKSGGNTTMAAAVNNAHEVLADPEERRRYDIHLSSSFR